MSRALIYIIDGFLVSYFAIYISSKILYQEINYRSSKFWICFLLEALYMIFSYALTDSFVRVIINYLLLSLLNIFLFQITVFKSVATSFITMFLLLISEIIYMLTITMFFIKDPEQIKQTFFLDVISNIVICLIGVILIHINPIRKTFYRLVSNIRFKGNKTILLYSVFSLSSLSILLYFVYFKMDNLSAGFLCLILVITFALLTLYLFKEKNDNYKLQVEYEILEQNLEEYEKMYQAQRMMNHEYKNELSTVRGLVNKKNIKLQNYLDKLIDVRMEKQTKWMETLKRIPEPTLRGLLYYKFSTMDHKKIRIDFEISKNVTIKKFQLISQELYKKICRLLGIYLDNAIQAVESLKEKSIRVEFYLDPNSSDILIISIFNSFEGKVDIDRMNEKGYSTKGKGRGLGLAMANETIKEEKRISSETQIFKNSFGQKLKIQLKK